MPDWHGGGLMANRWMAYVLAAACGLGSTAHVQQDYPWRLLRFIVPFPPGGSADSVARTMSRALTQQVGQQWLVDNRPGVDIDSRRSPALVQATDQLIVTPASRTTFPHFASSFTTVVPSASGELGEGSRP